MLIDFAGHAAQSLAAPAFIVMAHQPPDPGRPGARGGRSCCNAAAKSVPLSVVSIDTGAGSVVLKEPVIIGFVVADREGVVCEDTCRLALDGFCDDGSEGAYEEYYESYGYYQDDNGGFYEGPEGSASEKGGASAYVRTTFRPYYFIITTSFLILNACMSMLMRRIYYLSLYLIFHILWLVTGLLSEVR